MEMTASDPIRRRATRAAMLAGLALVVAGPALGQDRACYRGGAASGELTFAGAVEGSGFTGSFGRFEVEYCMPPGRPADGDIEVRVELGSADSGNRDRDTTLLGEEFFDVERHPVSTWTSTVIEAAGAGPGNEAGDGYRAAGRLELKGISADQPIAFRLRPDGEAIVAEGRFTLGGSAEVDRQRFDVGTGEFADPEFVRNRVDVEFEVVLGPP